VFGAIKKKLRGPAIEVEGGNSPAAAIDKKDMAR
jgi:hypothetical protein